MKRGEVPKAKHPGSFYGVFTALKFDCPVSSVGSPQGLGLGPAKFTALDCYIKKTARLMDQSSCLGETGRSFAAFCKIEKHNISWKNAVLQCYGFLQPSASQIYSYLTSLQCHKCNGFGQISLFNLCKQGTKPKWG